MSRPVETAPYFSVYRSTAGKSTLSEILFEEPAGVAVEDVLHLVLGKALAAEGLRQQRELRAVVHLQLSANAVEVAAQTNDADAAHLLEMGRVLCHQGRGAAAELFNFRIPVAVDLAMENSASISR